MNIIFLNVFFFIFIDVYQTYGDLFSVVIIQLLLIIV